MIETGKLERHSGGAGVTNSVEAGSSPGDGDHTVDSSGWLDFIEVAFDKNVKVQSIEFGVFSVRSDNLRIVVDMTGDGLLGERLHPKSYPG